MKEVTKAQTRRCVEHVDTQEGDRIAAAVLALVAGLAEWVSRPVSEPPDRDGLEGQLRAYCPPEARYSYVGPT